MQAEPSASGVPVPLRTGSVRSAAFTVVLVGILCAPAAAEPAYPSDDEIDQARTAEDAAGDAVAAVEQRLADIAGRLDDLHVSAARAVEAHNGARVALAEAEQAERAATQAASSAAAEAEVARDHFGRLAAAAYRTGGPLSTVGFVLEAETEEDFFDGAAVLRSVTQTQGSVYERRQQTFDAAAAAAARAQEALDHRRAAQRAAREAFDDAVRAVEDQSRALASAEADHDALVAELAAARGTTVELERQRQAGLQAEQAAEREREALATAAADAESEDVGSEPVVGEDVPAAGTSVAPEPVAPPAPALAPAPAPGPAPAPAPPPAPAPAPAPAPVQAPSAPAARRPIDYAGPQLGKPYQWGAAGPDAFDCSGLTMRAWQAGGENLPHWSVAQARAVTRVSYANIRPGDLVFWSDDGQASGTYHVGLYIGRGKMIHAPRPGKVVEVQSVFYWRTPSFYGRV